MWFIKRLSIALVAVVLLSSIVVVTARYELRRDADRIIRSSYELFQQQQGPSLDNVRERVGDRLKQTLAKMSDVDLKLCSLTVYSHGFISSNLRPSSRRFG